MNFIKENMDLKAECTRLTHAAERHRDVAAERLAELQSSQAQVVQLTAALEKISLYKAYNGDTWPADTARQALSTPNADQLLTTNATSSSKQMEALGADKLYGYAFEMARGLMAPDAFELFVIAMDEKRAALSKLTKADA